jgi:hypothetical protein
VIASILLKDGTKFNIDCKKIWNPEVVRSSICKPAGLTKVGSKVIFSI